MWQTLRLSCIVLVTMAAAHATHADLVDEALTQDPRFDAQYPASVIELSIPSHGEKMPGHLYLASGAGPHPTVVFLHGFPGNERNLDVAQVLRRAGFNTLYFQYRGAWGATGEYRITQLPDDAQAVLDFLRDAERAREWRVNTSALSVLGHSLGGYTALATGARDTDLRCVMALSPANVGLWQTEMRAGEGETATRLQAYADTLYMLQGLTGQRLTEELLAADTALLDTRQFARGLAGKSVLMLVGEQDAVTPASSMFDPVVDAYRQRPDIDLTASIISGDHSFSWSRIALTREIVNWADARCR